VPAIRFFLVEFMGANSHRAIAEKLEPNRGGAVTEKRDGARIIRQLWERFAQGEYQAVAATLAQLDIEGCDPETVVEAKILRSVCARLLGDIDTAEMEALASFALAKERGFRELMARAAEAMAEFAIASSQLDRAAADMERAREATRDSGYWCHLTLALVNIELRRGCIVRAKKLLDEVQSRSKLNESIAIRRLTAALLVSDPEAILRCIRSVQRQSDSTEVQVRFVCLLARGIAHRICGRPDLATKNFRKARTLNDERLHNPDFGAEVRLRHAEALLESGPQRRKALAWLEELLAERERLHNPLLLAEIYRVQAKALRLGGRPEASDAVYQANYELTREPDRALYRFFALREHAESLLEELTRRNGADSLLRTVLADGRGCVRMFDHPVFAWNLRVLEALASSRLAPEPEICELEECREAVRAAGDRGEISAHHRDTWMARLQAEIAAGRERLREALARDVAAMDEIVTGMRSENARAHLRDFTRAVGERFGADRVLMVIESDAAGTLDLIAAHGLDDATAITVTRTLMPLLGPDEPALFRDLATVTDPVGQELREVLGIPGAAGSLDGAIVAAAEAGGSVAGESVASPSAATANASSRSAMAFAIDGAGVVAGLIYLDQLIAPKQPGYRSADLRDFAFLANGLAAVSRLASVRARREVREIQDRLQGVSRRHGIVTRAPAMQRVLERMERVADSDLSILILGESGTGKELVARAIHAASSRRDGPFVAVNCAAIPAHLLEAELFGHTRGAFTGATQARKGYFAAADSGTIFLDEIGDLPREMQAKLLRVIEQRRVTPLGQTQAQPVDFRIVAATNAGLEEQVEAGSFRSDLFFRLRGYTLNLPPLRERVEDVRLLADHFLRLQEAAQNLPENRVRFSAEAYRVLERHNWPGNVRELRHVVHSACLLRDLTTQEIGVDALMDHVSANAIDRAGLPRIDPALLERLGALCDRMGAVDLLAEIEQHLTSRALRRTGGNQRAAARVLRMKESTVRRRLKTWAEQPGGE
jgi:transcriptional regulator with GAF, ATPase, and Fis domain